MNIITIYKKMKTLFRYSAFVYSGIMGLLIFTGLLLPEYFPSPTYLTLGSVLVYSIAIAINFLFFFTDAIIKKCSHTIRLFCVIFGIVLLSLFFCMIEKSIFSMQFEAAPYLPIALCIYSLGGCVFVEVYFHSKANMYNFMLKKYQEQHGISDESNEKTFHND